MSNFSFPENCFYCTTNFGSQHCVLPFEIVKNFKIPKDHQRMVMEVTQLHCSTDIGLMQYSATHSSWHASQADNQSVSEPEKIPVPVDLPRRETASPVPQTETHSAPQIEKPTEPTFSAIAALKPDESKTHSDEFLLVTRDKKAATEAPPRYTLVCPEIIIPDKLRPVALVHLCTDVTLAAVTAYTMRKLKRNFTVEDFIDSFAKECNIKLTHSHDYTKSQNLVLNHPIALAKELVAIHDSNESLLRWKRHLSTPDLTETGCLTRHPYFQNREQNSHISKPLDNTLISYCLATISAAKTRTPSTDSFFTTLKSSFASRKSEKVYDWLKNTSTDKILNSDTRFYKDLKNNSSDSKSTTKEHKTAEPHSCPPVPALTEQLLKNHLKPSITEALKDTLDTPFEPGAQKTCAQVLTALLSELIRHNPTWRSRHFSISPNLLEAACLHANFTLEPTSAPMITYLLANALNTLKSKDDD